MFWVYLYEWMAQMQNTDTKVHVTLKNFFIKTLFWKKYLP